ncbi:MAG: phospholipase D family protein [Gammaproteobacteria bacterium PRO9]|nr:phospholipase D family protein [Gammaproteobacteria bacterium PRO9]
MWGCHRTRVAFKALVLVLLADLVVACSGLPALAGRTTSTALVDTGATRLGAAIAPLAAAHPGASGIHALADARDAFAARMLLARSAERSLDVQYYIWRNDLSGTLLFNELREAADRGVRVRLLLDDNNTPGLDPTLAALDSHPNIEVRLFNPFVHRGFRLLGYLTDFSRLNRRMHNKSFTADNQATIIGGRNVGDEYFDATDGTAFVDVDVLAIGPIVNDVSRDFDRYWASDSSYPVGRLLPESGTAQLAGLASQASAIALDAHGAAYLQAVKDSHFVRELVEGRLPLDWAVTRMVSDDPAKGLGLAAPDALLPAKLQAILGEPSTRLDLVSAYFVPGKAGTAWFVAQARRGVKIQILTNSLEATDVAAVHAGYAKYRRRLLEAGITLYELERIPHPAPAKRGPGRFGSSGSSLHAKTFSVDGSRVFVGSFNFDPRSANLNTELGFVIDSPTLAQAADAVFTETVPISAYEVRLTPGGKLVWLEHRGTDLIRHDAEPGTGFWRRAGVWFISLLPVEWLL